jgi:predicted ribosome quality control (RQC) complex YloA/Tae2 family protein
VHQETLKEIVDELDKLLPGRFLGTIFQLSAFSLAVDFGVKDAGYLFISIEPAAPRLYMIKRSVRELAKATKSLVPFAQAMRATLNRGKLLLVSKDEGERVVRFSFSLVDEVSVPGKFQLVAQLTGRSANLFLLDEAGKILQSWRMLKGDGQQIGDLYRPPPAQVKAPSESPRITRGESLSISAAADKHYRHRDTEKEFESRAASLRAKLLKEINRRKKLQTNLRKDLVAHGAPEEHKRLGDLLLANILNAKRAGTRVTLTDYYAEGTPAIEIEVDENQSLQDAAGESFSRYTKAKRAIEEIAVRLGQLDKESQQFKEKRDKLEGAIASSHIS